MRTLNDPVLNTNLLFFLNALFYYEKGYLLCALIVGLSAYCSYKYHLFKEQNQYWTRADQLFATLALIITLIFAIPCVNLERMGVISFLLVSSFYFKFMAKYDYKFFHVLWHISVFLGQCYLCSILK